MGSYSFAWRNNTGDHTGNKKTLIPDAGYLAHILHEHGFRNFLSLA
jgi:hypothetical protein